MRFIRPLQDVVATEKDKVILECELSRPNADVRWLKVPPLLPFCPSHPQWVVDKSGTNRWAAQEPDRATSLPQDDVELQVGKMMGMVAQGACRTLIIYRCVLGDQGVYMCDAHDAQTSASVKVQGEGWTE